MRMEKEELVKKLIVKKKVDEVRLLDEPQTVCGHINCIEYRSDGPYNMREQRTIYKTVCHPGCIIRSIEANTKGHPDLRFCSRFQDSHGVCTNCAYSWRDHLHIKYELQSVWMDITDSSIQRQLDQRDSSIGLIEKANAKKK